MKTKVYWPCIGPRYRVEHTPLGILVEVDRDTYVQVCKRELLVDALHGVFVTSWTVVQDKYKWMERGD